MIPIGEMRAALVYRLPFLRQILTHSSLTQKEREYILQIIESKDRAGGYISS